MLRLYRYAIRVRDDKSSLYYNYDNKTMTLLFSRVVLGVVRLSFQLPPPLITLKYKSIKIFKLLSIENLTLKKYNILYQVSL